MKLRDYQAAAVYSLFRYYESGNTGNPIIALPTGCGKSLIIGDFIRRAILDYPGTRVMKLTHVKELVGQNLEKLLALWPTAPAGVYSAGLGRKEVGYSITFGGVASVVKCPIGAFGRIDLLIVDECHLVSPDEDAMYQKIIANLKEINPYLKVIGLSATPYRLGQGMLTEPGGIFTDICFDMTTMECFNWLLEEGYLAPLVPKATNTVLDVTGVGTSGGEYKQKQLQAAVDIDYVTDGAVQEMITCGHDRKHWLVFASGVDHTEHVAAALNSYDIKTTYVHSKMSSSQRDANIKDWINGDYQAMINNGILTTGIDFPALDLIGILRPTKSTSLWVQMLGRATRPHPGKKDALVLDFANNITRLGPINDPVLPRPKGAGGAGSAPVKLCPHCNTWNHASVRICCSCSAEFPKEVKIKEYASQLELIAKSEPIKTEVFKVDKVVYNQHIKPGKPSSIRVSYFCGLRRFQEWVSFEHSIEANRMAKKWWKERDTVINEDPPDSTKEALERLGGLKLPTHLRVWLKPKYDKILDYDYTNTSFGEKP